MRAFIVADKPGSIKASPEYVDMLRRETGDATLDVWWDPDISVYAPFPDRSGPTGTPSSQGAWVVWSSMPVLCISGDIAMVRQQWVDVYRLDGLYGWPRTLGTWVARVLRESNQHRRGGGRAEELNEMARQGARMQFAFEDDFARQFARNKLTKSVFARASDAVGTPILDHDDRLKMGAKVAMEEARINDEREALLQRMALYRVRP